MGGVDHTAHSRWDSLLASPSALEVRPESLPAYQGGAPGAGLKTTVAVVLAAVLVHPVPLVGMEALVTLSVFEPL